MLCCHQHAIGPHVMFRFLKLSQDGPRHRHCLCMLERIALFRGFVYGGLGFLLEKESFDLLAFYDDRLG